MVGSGVPPPKLGQRLRPYLPRLAVGALLVLLTNALEKAIPWFLQHAIDGLREAAFGRVKEIALAVAAIAAVMWAVRTLSRVQVFNVGRDVEYDVRNELLSQVHRLGPTFFRSMSTGEIMSRATSDLGQIRLLVGFGAMSLTNTVFAYVLALGLMVLISPTLTLIALAPYPAFAVLTMLFSRGFFSRGLEAQEVLGRMTERVQESISGIRVVRSLGLDRHELERFDAINRDAIEKNMRLVVLRGLMWPVLTGVGSIAILLVIWFGGRQVLRGELTPGQLAAFLAYLGQLLMPTMALGYLLSIVQRGRASYGRISAILAAEPEIAQADEPLSPEGNGHLEVRSLHFELGGRTILDDVSFDVPAGRSVAVVGGVGEGKSTLAALSARLLPVPEGSVFLDGVDITKLQLAGLRRAVAYAPQEPFLFSTTIERNIAFALDDPNAEGATERVRAAAAEAAVLAEIDSLPDGFSTQVGERGVQLSGGQKQRIALARALLNDPKVLVLDDPMSAVDARTEALILAALERAGEGRTLVLVTHRIAAAARADEVILLEGGKVAERGSHEELVARGGTYARMAARQSLEKELEVR